MRIYTADACGVFGRPDEALLTGRAKTSRLKLHDFTCLLSTY
jgi:hypothetical protein